MVSRTPSLLNFIVKRMDNRLGFYQQQLGLSAQKTVLGRLCAAFRHGISWFAFPDFCVGVWSQLRRILKVLNAKYLCIKERLLFLQYLDKAQYDPAKPNYISLDKLVSLPDEAFCNEVAAATLKDVELFQKTV